jgi:hypothetical protein
LEQFLEVARRASLVVVWVGGLGLALMFAIAGLNSEGPDGPIMYTAAAVMALLTWIVAKLVNWVLLK